MYQLPQSDRIMLMGIQARGGRMAVTPVVLSEVARKRLSLVSLDLVVVEGNELVLTDKGRQWLTAAAEDDLF